MTKYRLFPPKKNFFLSPFIPLHFRYLLFLLFFSHLSHKEKKVRKSNGLAMTKFMTKPMTMTNIHSLPCAYVRSYHHGAMAPAGSIRGPLRRGTPLERGIGTYKGASHRYPVWFVGCN